jgi:hypothetical protein
MVKDITTILCEIGLQDDNAFRYYKEAVSIAKKNKKNGDGITLASDILPALSKKFKATQTAIDIMLLRGANRAYSRTNPVKYLELFKTTSKLTPLKLIKALLRLVNEK